MFVTSQCWQPPMPHQQVNNYPQGPYNVMTTMQHHVTVMTHDIITIHYTYSSHMHLTTPHNNGGILATIQPSNDMTQHQHTPALLPLHMHLMTPHNNSGNLATTQPRNNMTLHQCIPALLPSSPHTCA